MSLSLPHLTFIYGPPRSGKSWAIEQKLKEIEVQVLYLATLPRSPQFRDIIAAHQSRRPATWTTIELEAPLDKDDIDCVRAVGDGVVLLEGLHIYVFRRAVYLCEQDDKPSLNECIEIIDTELHALENSCKHLVVVSAPPIFTLNITEISELARNVVVVINDRVQQRANHIILYCAEGSSYDTNLENSMA